MKERLQKILSSCGLASRRRAEEMIRAGRVSVNGKTAELGASADPDTDIIQVDGEALPVPEEHIYLMLNKPRGYVTTLSDEKGRPTAASLVAGCGARVYPVGRLDMDSQGLLLFTNDGEWANRMMHPRTEVDKCYEVRVRGFGRDSLRRIQEPVELDGYRIRRPRAVLMSQSGDQALLQITIHEGRNRQVRRMCEIAGMSVVGLKRISEGSIRLGELPEGSWRLLTREEIGASEK